MTAEILPVFFCCVCHDRLDPAETCVFLGADADAKPPRPIAWAHVLCVSFATTGTLKKGRMSEFETAWSIYKQQRQFF